MGLFDHFKSNHDEAHASDTKEHKSKLSHEVIAGAAAFQAAKAYEAHQQANGKPANHSLAKELIAGLAAAELDKLFETKGLDHLDREKAKKKAKEQAEALYEEKYQ